MASIRNPEMGLVFDRQFKVMVESLRSEMRTRRGGLISSCGLETISRKVIIPKLFFKVYELTLKSCDLSLDWSAGQRVLQCVNLDFVSCCNLIKI